ncbi:MAG TPA: decarboxylase [Lachnospiraceae bacterium]|nr:decarboxylase [Lachnospiraceae bacterium]
MEHLYGKLSGYAEGDIYPYHMPGHKRRSWGELPEAMYRMDITEIEDFDNLHQPEGILLKLQREAARLYGAEESHYLVNGSTCGILSAVSSAIPFGGHILMARNCHKSAYHAAYLRHLKVSYLYSDCLAAYGIWDAVKPEQVRRALEAAEDIRAVLIVSPTYEGRIADVSEIAGIVHAKGIPLIVDEAHGAHLGLAEGFPKNSCQAGADLVIHSVHKTLPALTQTALLHVNGDLVDRDRLRRFLRIYQSSSPSYLLMAGIDNALEYVRRQGKTAFGQFLQRYEKMTEVLKGCRCLQILSGSRREQDVGKLVVSPGRSGITGKRLSDILLNEYHLQTEMSSKNFVLAMFTLNDGEEAYRRMTEALLEIDDRLSERNAGEIFSRGRTGYAAYQGQDFTEDGKLISLWKAWDMEGEEVALESSIGKYAAEFVNLYPPGVPLLAPGERMTEGLYREILEDLEAGLTVQGIRVEAGKERLPRGIFIKMIHA